MFHISSYPTLCTTSGNGTRGFEYEDQVGLAMSLPKSTLTLLSTRRSRPDVFLAQLTISIWPVRSMYDVMTEKILLSLSHYIAPLHPMYIIITHTLYT